MTMYRKVDCPHCGNEITVNSDTDVRKCRWCKRLVAVNFERKGKGKKVKCKVEAIDFPDEKEHKEKKGKKEKKIKREPFRKNIRSYLEWKDEDVYGKTRK